MAYRELTGPDGRVWRVWNTDPHALTGRHVIAAEYVSGWLTFETEGEKRRLAPIPPNWESLDRPDLLHLLEAGEVVQGRAALTRAPAPAPASNPSLPT